MPNQIFKTLQKGNFPLLIKGSKKYQKNTLTLEIMKKIKPKIKPQNMQIYNLNINRYLSSTLCK
jgi:hypothetical protein